MHYYSSINDRTEALRLNNLPRVKPYPGLNDYRDSEILATHYKIFLIGYIVLLTSAFLQHVK